MTSLAANPNFHGVCIVCGKEFDTYVPPSRRPPQTCSQACNGKSRAGIKHSAESREKRKRFGPDHHAWKGDDIAVKSGRTRALRMYPDAPPVCERCGEAKRLERHHVDGNTANNSKSNIRFLCRLCHMTEDARLANLIKERRRASHNH